MYFFKTTRFLKSIIEPQEGTVEIIKSPPTKMIHIFTNTHSFSHEQTGYGYHSTEKRIVELKYKKLQIMGYVSDDRDYPFSYTFDEEDSHDLGDLFQMVFFNFDPDKTFLKQYLTQELNTQIRELTKEIVKINGKDHSN